MSSSYKSPFDALDESVDVQVQEVTTRTIASGIKKGRSRQEMAKRIVGQTSLNPGKVEFLIKNSIEQHNSRVANLYNFWIGLVLLLIGFCFFHSWSLFTTCLPASFGALAVLWIVKQRTLYLS
jgi:hypothetical protein